MAVYAIWIIAAAQDPNGRWRGIPERKLCCIGVGAAGMMVDATARLATIRSARAATALESSGVVLTRLQLETFLERPLHEVESLAGLPDLERYAVVAEET